MTSPPKGTNHATRNLRGLLRWALVGPVGICSMNHTNDGHGVMGFVDSVDDPVGASTCAVTIG